MATPQTVKLLGYFDRELLVGGVVETVTADTAFTSGAQGWLWDGKGGQYAISSAGELTIPSKTEKVPLSEVVYVVGNAVHSYVVSVLLVFKNGEQYIAVHLWPKTFAAFFKSLANTQGTIVSTVAALPGVHDSVAVIADAPSYPKLALTFTSATSSVPESAIAPSKPRIVGGVLRYTTAPARIFGVTVTPVGVTRRLVQASGPIAANTNAPCGSPFVPFGVLYEEECNEASITDGRQCAVRCYNGSDAISSPRAACQSGKVSYTAGGCAPGSVQATISVAGLTDATLNGTYVYDDAAQPIITWKSTTSQEARIVVSQSERHRLELRKRDVVAFKIHVLDEEPAPLLVVYTPQQPEVRVSATAVFGAAQTVMVGSSCQWPYLPFALLRTCNGSSVANGATCVVGCYEGFASDGGAVAACTDGKFAYKTGRCLPTERLRTIVLSGLGGFKSDGTSFPSELDGVYEHEATSLMWRQKSTTARIVASESEVGVLLLYTGDTAVYTIVVSNVAGIGPKLEVYDSAAPRAKVHGAAATLGLTPEQRSITVAGLRDPALNGIYEAAECADLRECLKLTPLAKCAAHAVACTATVSSGAKLEHGDKKVDLFTLSERALFGSDTRGVFVVSVSKDDAKKGKRLFVSAETNPSVVDVVDVEYDKDKQTWREVKGTNWIMIVGLIGGGVAAVIMLAVLVYLLSRSPQPTAIGFAPPFAPFPPMPPM
jgi:hypothetical protein